MKSSKSGGDPLRFCWFIFCGHDVPFNRVKREELLVTGRPAKRFEEENKKEDVL